MPTYEYVCSKCGQHLEVYQSFSEEPLKRHSNCGGKLSKVFAPVGIVLKGSGFYRTDNRTSSRSGESKEAASSGSGSKSEGGSGSEGSKDSSSSSSTKSESKSDSSKSSGSKNGSKSSEKKSA